MNRRRGLCEVSVPQMHPTFGGKNQPSQSHDPPILQPKLHLVIRPQRSLHLELDPINACEDGWAPAGGEAVVLFGLERAPRAEDFLVAGGLQGDCGWSGVDYCYAQGELAGLGFLAAAGAGLIVGFWRGESGRRRRCIRVSSAGGIVRLSTTLKTAKPPRALLMRLRQVSTPVLSEVRAVSVSSSSSSSSSSEGDARSPLIQQCHQQRHQRKT